MSINECLNIGVNTCNICYNKHTCDKRVFSSIKEYDYSNEYNYEYSYDCYDYEY